MSTLSGTRLPSPKKTMHHLLWNTIMQNSKKRKWAERWLLVQWPWGEKRAPSTTYHGFPCHNLVSAHICTESITAGLRPHKYLSLLLMQHTCMKEDVYHHCTSLASNLDRVPNYQIAVPWAADKCFCSQTRVCCMWKMVLHFVCSKHTLFYTNTADPLL